MSDLTAVFETYALSCSLPGLTDWAIAYTDQGPLPGIPSYGTTQGMISAAGLNTISSKPEPGHSYVLDFMCVRNDSLSVIQVISFGKIRMGVYYPFTPNFLLPPGEAFTYMKGYGFVLYDATGLPKISSQH